MLDREVVRVRRGMRKARGEPGGVLGGRMRFVRRNWRMGRDCGVVVS